MNVEQCWSGRKSRYRDYTLLTSEPSNIELELILLLQKAPNDTQNRYCYFETKVWAIQGTFKWLHTAKSESDKKKRYLILISYPTFSFRTRVLHYALET